MNVSREYTSDESDADDYIHIGTASGTCKKPLDILEWKYILIIGLLEKKMFMKGGLNISSWGYFKKKSEKSHRQCNS